MELKTSEEKEKILREEYELEISEDMKEELEKMGGLMEPLLEIAAEQAAKEAAEKAAAKATAETEKITLLRNIRSAMKSWDLTAEDAMNGLDVAPELQKKLLPLI